MSELRRALAIAQHWPVLPVQFVPAPRPGDPEHLDKVPPIKDWWNRACQDPGTIKEWWRRFPNAGVGIPTGTKSGVIVVDIDDPAALRESGLDLSDGVRVPTHRPGGSHYYFALPISGNLPPGNVDGRIDCRSQGNCAVVWGEPPERSQLKPLPEKVGDFFRARSGQRPSGDGSRAPGAIPEGQRNNTLTSLAGTMRRGGMSAESISAALQKENTTRCVPPLPTDEVEKIALSISRYEPGPDARTKNRWRGSSQRRTVAPNPGRLATDLGNAQRLVDEYGEDLRYVPDWRTWLVWNDTHWHVDRTSTPAQYARAIAEELRQECFGHPEVLPWVKRTQSGTGMAAMVKLASDDSRVLATADMFDQHPELLVVANGTVDLRSGELRASDRADLMTKASPIAYDPEAECPEWEKFLERVQPDDAVRQYLKRAFGYSLTGEVREEKLFFCYGSGANGKSVLGDVLRRMLGPSAQPGIEGLLTSTKQEPWMTADLQGKRVIFCNETNQDGTLNEQRVKQITSPELIRAARKYGHPFSFWPTHKLWVRGNYQPRIVGTDDGIWRRISCISFDVAIPERERNPGFLEEVLVPEMSGILAWSVRGAVEWYQSGLKEPPLVRDAVKRYRQDQDILGRFLEDRCDFGSTFSTTSTMLGGALTAWCSEEAVFPTPSQKALASRLSKRGVQRRPSNGATWWHGVRLRKEDHELQGETSEVNRLTTDAGAQWG